MRERKVSNKVIIGIDPDSSAHGFAVYEGGKLAFLKSLTLLEIMDFITNAYPSEMIGNIEVHIEDVNGVSAAFRAKGKKDNINVKLKMAQHIGQCKQAQIELERLFEYLSIKVVKHQISKQWKDTNSGKTQFKLVTKWDGKSNEDTRSAAYFGFLGL